MADRIVPRSVPEDSDDVVVALETARAEEEREDHAGAAEWLRKAASAARKDGRPERAGQLSRAAAGVGRPSDPPEGKFERREEAEQVLSDIEDDFSDETIVDSVEKLKAGDDKPAKQVLKGATPVAPGALQKSPAAGHRTIRVAARKSLAGKLELRPLGSADEAGAGEEEALLILLKPGSKLL